MSSYLITGASRGLGLGLVQLLASKPISEVGLIFASGRKPSETLSELIETNPGRVHFIELEISDKISVEKAVKQVETILEEHKATLDVLVNNAAILNYTPDGVDTMSDLSETLNINVVGTHLVTAGFLPLLKKGNAKKVANVSSTLGSLALSAKFAHMPSPAYKISKAATNMLTRQYAHDLAKDEFSVFCLSPGWVKTDMGSEDAELSVEQSVSAILEIITNADKNSNGKFFDIHVPGWEDAPGLNQYPGGEPAW
ncbi:short-chain dehydrogenase-like protein [Flagelloscypha sp. PMI_526]|nr:short-chain dehydrogenase-like protein [Flagelloscypha sp. PMI_526]